MPTRTSRRALLAAGTGLLVAAAPAAASAQVPVGHPGPAPDRLLERGSAGPAVDQVQRALHIAATGRFGRATVRAVRAFQRADHLHVDGIVGPRTWGALFGVKAPARSGWAGSRSGGSGSAGSGAARSGAAGYAIPAGIVACESGGDYSAVNSSSGAGGAYQILPSTWHAYGGTGLPQDAPKAEQDRIAGEIYATQGRSAWSC